MTEQKKAKNVAARRSSPWQGRIKVHIGKTVQTARSGENEQAAIFWKCLLKRIETKRSHNYGCTN